MTKKSRMKKRETIRKKVAINEHIDLCGMCGIAFSVKSETPSIPLKDNPPGVGVPLSFCSAGCHSRFRRAHGMPEWDFDPNTGCLHVHYNKPKE